MKTEFLVSAVLVFSSVAYGGRYNVKSSDLVLDRPSDSFVTRPMVFDYRGAPLDEPVWVDLLTGRVYVFPKEDMLVPSAGVTFVNVPVYDSPCVLTERAALKAVARAAAPEWENPVIQEDPSVYDAAKVRISP